jgi:hypothetical protein
MKRQISLKALESYSNAAVETFAQAIRRDGEGARWTERLKVGHKRGTVMKT